MIEVHAHEILRMMEGNNYTKETLKLAIHDKFGTDARFNTCSASDMDADAIIDFLTAKGKFKDTQSGFTMDIEQVCRDY